MKYYTSQIFTFLFAIHLFGQNSIQHDYSIGTTHTIYSEVLNEDRDIFISVPHGFWGLDDNIKQSPLTIVLDGESQFQHTVAAIDFLSSAPNGNDLMPRSIIVGIKNTNRVRDLTPINGILGNNIHSLEATGGGVRFLEFITTELIPYIDSSYSTIANRTLIGHSLGGLIVFEALLNHRDYFNNYLVIDPALDFDNGSYMNTILDTLNKAILSDETLFVAKANGVPPILKNKDISQDTAQLLRLPLAILQFFSDATSHEWNIKHSLIDYPTDDHFSVAYPATSDGLRFFYSYYPFKDIINYFHPAVTDSDLVDKLKLHFENISKELGHTVIPMESYLNSWAFGISEFGRVDLSIDLFDYSIELYPENASAFTIKADFMRRHNHIQQAIKLYEKSLTLENDESIINLIKQLK